MGKLDVAIDSQSLNYLKEQNYLNVYSKDDYNGLKSEVSQMENLSSQISSEKEQFQKERSELEEKERKEHSIRFHLEKKDKKKELEMDVKKQETEVQDVYNIEKTQEEKLNQLMAKKSLLNNLVPYNEVYIYLTDKGKVCVHDLALRLYRFSDEDFTNYEKDMSTTLNQLNDIVKTSKIYYTYLEGIIPDVEQKSTLLSTAIGLAKFRDDVTSMENKFRSIYQEMGSFTKNIENRLMATEILTGSGKDVASDMDEFKEVFKKVRHESHIPRESATAVAAIMYLSRRYDGTYPFENLDEFRKLTPSYESAAIMASINKDINDTRNKFVKMRQIFSQWGYDESEDMELSSAYVAISELQPDEIKDKLSVIIDAIKNYLEYPLVASTVVATVPVMESNETLDLLSKAYNILENSVSGFERSEIMAAAVSLVHGIRNELITNVDSKAPVMNTPYHFYYMPSPFLFPFFMPMLMVQGCYYSTFSGIGGVHPAHIHSVGGFSG